MAERNGRTAAIWIAVATFVVGGVTGALSTALALTHDYVTVVTYNQDETRRREERREFLQAIRDLSTRIDQALSADNALAPSKARD